MFKTWIFVGILLTILCGAAYYYYDSTQTRLTKLTENNAVLKGNNAQLLRANEENLNTIDEQQKNFEEIRNSYTELESDFQITRMQNSELRERLGKHELSALAAAKPKLVENVINNASKNAMRCFELMSGAPLTERERNAKSEKEFNSECPWLWNTTP